MSKIRHSNFKQKIATGNITAEEDQNNRTRLLNGLSTLLKADQSQLHTFIKNLRDKATKKALNEDEQDGAFEKLAALFQDQSDALTFTQLADFLAGKIYNLFLNNLKQLPNKSLSSCYTGHAAWPMH